jgi:hypothetical protein
MAELPYRLSQNYGFTPNKFCLRQLEATQLINNNNIYYSKIRILIYILRTILRQHPNYTTLTNKAFYGNKLFLSNWKQIISTPMYYLPKDCFILRIREFDVLYEFFYFPM